MKRFFQSLLVMLGGCALLPFSTAAAPVNRADHVIPTRIESLSKKKDALPLKGSYDSNALVYYVYHIDCTQGNNYNARRFASETGFMAEAHKKLAGTGAELLMHITPAPTHAGRNGSKLAPIVDRMAGQTDISCSVLNNGHKQVRKIFFQNAADESTIQRLRAIDSNGRLLAYFSMINDSIIMYDKVLNTRKVLKKSGFSHSQWEAEAMLASLDMLVKQARRSELAAIARAKAQARAAGQESRKSEPSPKKPRKKAKPSRMVEPEDEEDDFDDEDSEEEEDDFLDGEDDDFLDEDEE